MVKLIRAYLIGNWKKSLSLMIVLAVSICIIFSNATAKKSQMEYVKTVMRDNRPKAELVYNDISVEQLDRVKDYKNIKSYTKVAYYGNVTYKDRFTSGLIDYDRDYFDNFKLILKKGRFPRSKDEIILYEDTMKAEKFELGQEIDLRGYKKYYNLNKRINIENYGMSPKIVGVYTCPEVMKGFYFDDCVMVGKGFSKVKHKSYKGTIELEKGVDAYSAGLDISSKMDSNSDHVYIDGLVSRMQEEDMGLMDEKDSLDWSFIILSVFMAFNILCLMANQISSDQGLLRVIGLSKRRVLIFEFFRNAVLFALATCLGIVFSGPLARFFTRIFIYTSLNVNMSEAPLAYNWDCMKNVILILSIVVIFSILVPSINVFSKSPIEQYQGISNYKIGHKLNVFINKVFKGFDARIVTRSIINQKVFVVVSAVIVGYSGYLYSKEYCMLENWEQYAAPLVRSFRDYDIRLSQKSSLEGFLGGYSMDDVDKIRSIDGVKTIYSKSHSFGYMYVTPDRLTKEYKAQRLIKDSNKEAEIRFDILGMPRDMLIDFVDRDKILESGRLPSDRIENDIVEVLMYNNFYLKMEERGTFNLLKDVKLGDVIEIALENYDKTTGKIAYKNQKMKVVGFVDRVWDSFYDTEVFVPDIIMDPAVYGKVTGFDKFSNVEIKLVEATDVSKKEDVYKKISSIFKNRTYAEIKTLSMEYENMNWYAKIFRKKELATSIVLFVLAITNVIVGILLSFDVRKKEFGSLMSIGMSRNRLKKINLMNSIFIVVPGILGMFLAIIRHSIDSFEWVEMCAREQSIPFNETVNIPWIQMGIFSMVCFMCMILVSLYINRKINRINIIDMVRGEK